MSDIRDFGPNVKKLIIQFIAKKAIPQGGGMADGIEFIQSESKRKAIIEAAIADAVTLIDAVRPVFAGDDEAIAGCLLEKLDERKRNYRNR